LQKKRLLIERVGAVPDGADEHKDSVAQTKQSIVEKIRTMVGVHMDYMLPLGVVSPSGSPLPTSSLAPHHSALQSSGKP
jgi:hypothetical protein